MRYNSPSDCRRGHGQNEQGIYLRGCERPNSVRHGKRVITHTFGRFGTWRIPRRSALSRRRGSVTRSGVWGRSMPPILLLVHLARSWDKRVAWTISRRFWALFWSIQHDGSPIHQKKRRPRPGTSRDAAGACCRRNRYWLDYVTCPRRPRGSRSTPCSHAGAGCLRHGAR